MQLSFIGNRIHKIKTQHNPVKGGEVPSPGPKDELLQLSSGFNVQLPEQVEGTVQVTELGYQAAGLRQVQALGLKKPALQS